MTSFSCDRRVFFLTKNTNSSHSEIAILLLPEIDNCTSVVQIANIIEGAGRPNLIFIGTIFLC